MHHNNFGNFYTRKIYAIPIPIGFSPIPIPIPIMSRMAISIPMGFPWEWDSHGVSHSHAHLYKVLPDNRAILPDYGAKKPKMGSSSTSRTVPRPRGQLEYSTTQNRGLGLGFLLLMNILRAMSLRHLYDISTSLCYRDCAGLNIGIYSFNLVQIDC